MQKLARTESAPSLPEPMWIPNYTFWSFTDLKMQCQTSSYAVTFSLVEEYVWSIPTIWWELGFLHVLLSELEVIFFRLILIPFMVTSMATSRRRMDNFSTSDPDCNGYHCRQPSIAMGWVDHTQIYGIVQVFGRWFAPVPCELYPVKSSNLMTVFYSADIQNPQRRFNITQWSTR